MRTRDEGGFVTAEWMAGIAMLVVPMIVIVSALPAWAARHEGVAAAAREGARVAAASATVAQATSAAQDAVRGVLDARGLPVDGVEVDVSAEAAPTEGRLVREGVVTVRVTLPSVSVDIPFIGVVEGPRAAGSHSRHLDPFRSR